MVDEQQHLLTDLCRICNNQTPKYCCPRCSSRTCSLTCYKRHKLWSQCSGKRDPAAYVKKSQLATPAGIDRDYNFLTGVERAFERADRDADDRGIHIYDDSKRDAKDGSNLDKYLRSNNIVVDRAPLGMSRQKTNHTRWLPKQKSIVWTVEWVLEDGTKLLRECVAEKSITGAFEVSVCKARQPAGGNAKKKRKLDASPEHPPKESSTVSQADAEPTISDADTQQQEPNTPSNVETPNTTSPTQYFYLAKPHTSHTSRILIPLDPSATFTTCLRNRTVLEYPTIHVLPHPPSNLPEGYVTEAEYLGYSESVAQEIEEMIKGVPELKHEASDGGGGIGREEVQGDNRPLDERMIAEMLRKDVDEVP